MNTNCTKIATTPQVNDLFQTICRLWQALTPEDLEKIALIVHKPQIYHTEALADALEISRTQLYRLKKQGIIPPPRKIPGMGCNIPAPALSERDQHFVFCTDGAWRDMRTLVNS